MLKFMHHLQHRYIGVGVIIISLILSKKGRAVMAKFSLIYKHHGNKAVVEACTVTCLTCSIKLVHVGPIIEM